MAFVKYVGLFSRIGFSEELYLKQQTSGLRKLFLISGNYKQSCLRNFSQSKKHASQEKANGSVKPKAENSSNVTARLNLTPHTPNNFEKRLLVWLKKYPTIADVPDHVPQNVMERVRNVARIRMNIFFCGLAAVVCMMMIFSGKAAARRGESVSKQNIDWHKSIAEKSK